MIVFIILEASEEKITKYEHIIDAFYVAYLRLDSQMYLYIRKIYMRLYNVMQF